MSENLIGKSLGPYRVLERLGAGGAGEVYRAYDARLDRDVAVKRLLPQGDEAEQRRRLLQEARLAARLNHPNVVQVHDVLSLEHDDWLVMEWVEGKTLAHWIGSRALDMSQALGFAVDIVSGLAAAHDAGVLHQDLKSENVMVSPGGRAKILDFGLAGSLVFEDRGLEDTGTGKDLSLRGTPKAISPERVLGRPFGPPSDLFSLGVLLYELFGGRSPFLGPGPAETVARLLEETAPPLSDEVPDVPPPIVDLVERLLAKDPERRPQTAVAVLGTLQSVFEDHGLPPRSQVDWIPVVAEDLEPPERSFQEEDPDPESVGEGFRPSGFRREVTLTSCRLTGAGVLSPEMLFEVLPAFQSLAADVMDRHGGYLVALRGHHLTTCHGYPKAHEHDAVRALLFAADLIRAIEKAPPARRHGVQAKVGVQTGPALVLDEEEGPRLLWGPTLDRARELGEQAAPGKFSCSQETGRRAAELLGCPVERVEDRVLALLRDKVLQPRAWTRPSIELVGRRLEIGLLQDACDGVLEGRGSAFWILGEAGIGKSALLQAISQRNPPTVRRFRVRAAPGVPQDLLVLGRSLLTEMLGGHPLDEPEALRQGLRSAWTGAESDVSGLIDDLGPWLQGPGLQGSGLQGPGLQDPSLDGRTRPSDSAAPPIGGDSVDALVSWVTEWAEQSPTVITIDDLHLFDPAAQELVAALVTATRDAPLVLVVTSRPQLDGGWAQGLPIHRLPLSTLDPTESSELLSGLGALDASLDKDACASIIDSASGVPGHLVAAFREPRESAPEALRAGFAAQLDRLGEDGDVARLAAAPRPMDRAALAALLRLDLPDVDQAVDRLIAGDILERDSKTGTVQFRRELFRRFVWSSLLAEDQKEILRRLEPSEETTSGETTAEETVSRRSPPGR